MFSKLLGFFRLFAFALFVSFFSIIFYFSSLFWDKENQLRKGILLRNFLVKGLNIILGIRLTIYGKEPSVPGLLIANHRSYFDPLVLLNQKNALPVGKKEVESWPIIGYVCRISGVIFVDRKNPESRQNTAQKIHEALENGYSVINFPEGTTHIEPVTIDFNYGSFAMAAKINAWVIPIAIDYKVESDAFINDDTFIPHFLKCFSKKITEIKISYLSPIQSNDADYLLTIAKKGIDSELIRFHKDWNKTKMI